MQSVLNFLAIFYTISVRTKFDKTNVHNVGPTVPTDRIGYIFRQNGG
jgi:hypothetical protein